MYEPFCLKSSWRRIIAVGTAELADRAQVSCIRCGHQRRAELSAEINGVHHVAGGDLFDEIEIVAVPAGSVQSR